MRRLVLTFAVLVVGLIVAWQCLAQSQMTLIGAGKPPSSGGAPAFTGPGDIVTFSAWYGVRAYSATKRGNSAMDVCNTIGGVEVACVTYSTDATTGDLVITTIGGLTCASLGVNCTIKKFYDQTQGNNCTSATCDLTQSTISLRFVLNPSCVGGKPCFVCSGSVMSSANALSSLSTFTVSEVSERTGSTAAIGAVAMTGDASNGETYYAASANTMGMYAGTPVTVGSITDNTWHARQAVYNGASSNMYIDGSANTVNPGAGAASGTILLCAASGGAASPFPGNVGEMGFAPSAFSTAGGGIASQVNSNQHSYYGF